MVFAHYYGIDAYKVRSNESRWEYCLLWYLANTFLVSQKEVRSLDRREYSKSAQEQSYWKFRFNKTRQNSWYSNSILSHLLKILN